MIYLPKTNEFTVIEKILSGTLFTFNDMLVAFLREPKDLQKRYSLEVYTMTLKFHNNLYLMNQFLKQFDRSIQGFNDGTYIYCDMNTGHIIKMDNVLFETILY